MALGLLLVILLPVSPLLLVAWICLRHAHWLVNQAEKHTPFSRFDSHLPLRGRWLRYATAALLASVGIVLLVLAMFAWRILLPRF